MVGAQKSRTFWDNALSAASWPAISPEIIPFERKKGGRKILFGPVLGCFFFLMSLLPSQEEEISTRRRNIPWVAYIESVFLP